MFVFISYMWCDKFFQNLTPWMHWWRKHKNLGGGGGTGVVFARAPGLRKYKVARATPKKADERGGGGGDSHPFFFSRTSFTLLGRGTLGTQHRPPGWQAKKKKKTWNLGGDTSPPPRFRRLCMNALLLQSKLKHQWLKWNPNQRP